MEKITFDQLPAAISELLDKVSNIERQLVFNDTKRENQPDQSDQLFTVHQAAEFLTLAVPTVYSMISRGELPVIKKTKRCYFLKADLIDYLKTGRKKTLSEIKQDAEEFFTKKNRG
jgi:excisionase family DNA binding protein